MSNSNREQVYGEIQQKKIEYFFNKTGINEISRAERYLDYGNWDEKKAVEKFFERHPNHKPSVKNNNNEINAQNYSNFQPIFAPPTQVSRRNKPQPNNKENKNENYLSFSISDTLYNYSYVNHEPKSETYYYIKKNLNPEKVFESFLKKLRKNKGIIIVFNEDSFERIKEQIKNIKDDNINLTIFQNCILFPVLNISSIGKEFTKKLSIVSYPTYIFCKYKDEMNLYITDKMEGGFEMSFFINSILKINQESEPNLNIKSEQSHRINEIKDKDKNKDKDKGHQNKQNENKDSSNLINNLLKDNYFDKKSKKIKNNKLKQINNDNNNNNNKNVKQNLEDDKKIVEPRNPNIQDKNFNNNNFDNINIGDFFLGNSQDILKLLNENNLYDNSNPNLNMNYNNNFINPNIHYNNIDNPIRKEYKNENQNIGKNDNNILADSIYQLTDAQVLQKREREMRELERQQEEKEKKEEEAKKMEIEEEERLNKIKNKYEKEAEHAKKYVPKEPDINNPDVCSIVFRVPDGEKNINRRFLKTDKIKVLFNYVKSIGRDIFMEPDSTGFDILCLGFPPKNLEDKKNNTLEEEGLYPNCILQIREK